MGHNHIKHSTVPFVPLSSNIIGLPCRQITPNIRIQIFSTIIIAIISYLKLTTIQSICQVHMSIMLAICARHLVNSL